MRINTEMQRGTRSAEPVILLMELFALNYNSVIYRCSNNAINRQITRRITRNIQRENGRGIGEYHLTSIYRQRISERHSDGCFQPLICTLC